MPRPPGGESPGPHQVRWPEKTTAAGGCQAAVFPPAWMVTVTGSPVPGSVEVIVTPMLSIAAMPHTGLLQRPPQRVHGGRAFQSATLALIHPARQCRDRPGDGERVVPIDQQGR